MASDMFNQVMLAHTHIHNWIQGMVCRYLRTSHVFPEEQTRSYGLGLALLLQLPSVMVIAHNQRGLIKRLYFKTMRRSLFCQNSLTAASVNWVHILVKETII